MLYGWRVGQSEASPVELSAVVDPTLDLTACFNAACSQF
jgi:hypothetical protein